MRAKCQFPVAVLVASASLVTMMCKHVAPTAVIQRPALQSLEKRDDGLVTVFAPACTPKRFEKERGYACGVAEDCPENELTVPCSGPGNAAATKTFSWMSEVKMNARGECICTCRPDFGPENRGENACPQSVVFAQPQR